MKQLNEYSIEELNKQIKKIQNEIDCIKIDIETIYSKLN